MVAYAIRYKCENIILFYPEIDKKEDLPKLEIKDEFSEMTIKIYPNYLPIKFESKDNLESMISNTKNQLKNKIKCKLKEIAK